jgi:DNA-binding LytR/AlgR family response regulator
MLKAIAIDDEPIALEVIKSLSSKISFIELLNCFTDAFKAIDFLQKEKIDLIFLDIKMPDISGIEFLKSISNPPMVIFTTAYSEHAVQSFELDAIDYLLKPFSQSRFLKACNKAYEQYKLKNSNANFSSAPESIFIKSGYDQIRILLDEILYVESNGNYMQFVLPSQKILSRLTMSEVEELLPAAAFVRIHRSYIVSKKQVNKIEKNAIWIKQIELPVGAAYLKEIQKIAG